MEFFLKKKWFVRIGSLVFCFLSSFSLVSFYMCTYTVTCLVRVFCFCFYCHSFAETEYKHFIVFYFFIFFIWNDLIFFFYCFSFNCVCISHTQEKYFRFNGIKQRDYWELIYHYKFQVMWWNCIDCVTKWHFLEKIRKNKEQNKTKLP